MSSSRISPIHALLLFCGLLLTAPLSAQKLEGKASFYGPKFEGKPTSTGEVFRKDGFSAASLDLPWGTIVEVTNLANGKTTQVRVNDCGPHAHGRIIDLSMGAARELGALKAGEIDVKLRIIRTSNSGPTCSRGAWAKKLKAAGKKIPPKPGAWKPSDTRGLLPPAVVQGPAPSMPVTQVNEAQPGPAGPLVGMAGYYPERHQGRTLSTGEIYDLNQLTAASMDYPYNTVLEVTNVVTGESVRVRVNDCGPFRPDQILELSHAAAARIGLLRAGTARVRTRVVSLGKDGPTCIDSPAEATTTTETAAVVPLGNPLPNSSATVVPPAAPPATSPGPATYGPSTVAPPKPAPEEPAAPAEEKFDPDAMLFGVQVAAFKNEDNAAKLVQELNARDVKLVYLATVGGVTRVFAGKFYFQSEARNEMVKLRVMGYEGASVRRVQ